MKISKSKLRQIIKEELAAVTEQDDSVAYEALANNVGASIRSSLEEAGLSPAAIRQAVGEALEEELGPVPPEESSEAAPPTYSDHPRGRSEWNPRGVRVPPKPWTGE